MSRLAPTKPDHAGPAARQSVANVARSAAICLAYLLMLGWAVSSAAAAPPSAPSPAEASAGSATLHHYEYLFFSGKVLVYDIDNGQQLVQEIKNLPDADGVRGAMVDPAGHILYISHGGDGPAGSFDGSLLAYDLVSGTLLWNRTYRFPIDSGALGADGRRIYMPSGENERTGIWNVLAASNGEPIDTIQGGTGAHNTIVSLDGKYVYLAGRDSNYLDVASTGTDRVVRRVGPLIAGVRPFTVNGANTLAYTTESEFLGFQVSSIVTGQVLYTLEFPGLTTPYPFAFSAPSHGITLTPDEKRLYVFDAVAEEVRVFDVSEVPTRAPLELAPVKLPSISGQQTQCSYDCSKSGWLQASLDGRYVYVGDAGSVIDTRTDQIVSEIPELAQTRVLLEVDWVGGVPAGTSTRYGLGHVTSTGPSPAPEPEGQPRPAPGGGETAPAPALQPGSSAVLATAIRTLPGMQNAPCRLTIGARRLLVRAQHAQIHLIRTGSAHCRGTVTLRHRSRANGARVLSIGSAHFSLTVGANQVVEVQLNRLGRALLRAHRRFGATASIVRSIPAPALLSTTRVTLNLR